MKENAMLVLTRKTQQRIQIGSSITITIVRIKGHSVRVGIEAPENVRIVRGELAAAMAEFRDGFDDVSAETESAEGAGEGATTHEPSTEGELVPPSDEAESDDTLLANVSRAPEPPLFGRTPGVSRASCVRRPPRLGPASLRKVSCR
jgi:carbon storage regulator CsrA